MSKTITTTLFIAATAALCCMPADAASRRKTTKKKVTSTQTTKAAAAKSQAEDAAATAVATADSTLTQSMTLERDFRPIVRDADKLPSHPTVEQTDITSRSAISYADWTAVPSTSTDLTRLKVGRVFDYAPFDTHRGWVDFRIGNYWNTDLSAGYYLIDRARTQLKVRTDWHATSQDINSNHRYMTTATRLPQCDVSSLTGSGLIEFTRRLDNFDWHVNVGYTGVNHTLLENNLHSVVDKYTSCALRQKTSDWEASFSFDNERHESDVKFEAGAEVHYFTYDMPTENREVQEALHADVSAPSPYDDLRAGLKVEVEMRQYGKDYCMVDSREVEALSEGLAASLTPYVTWDYEEVFHLVLGARADFVSDAKHHVGIAPDVHASYQLPWAGQYLYADVTGGVASPSVRALMREMPYYLPVEEHLNPWTVSDATVGYSNKVCGSLRGRIFVGAAYTLDALAAVATDGLSVGSKQMCDEEGNLLHIGTPVGVTTVLDNVDDLQLKAGAEVEFALNKYLTGEAGVTVYDHSDTKAGSHKAKTEVEAALRSHPVQPLVLELKYEGRYDRYAWYVPAACKVDLGDVNDLSLSGAWTFKNDLTVRADLHNLLNEKQDVWLGVPGQRFNFQVGLKWLF